MGGLDPSSPLDCLICKMTVVYKFCKWHSDYFCLALCKIRCKSCGTVFLRSRNIVVNIKSFKKSIKYESVFNHPISNEFKKGEIPYKHSRWFHSWSNMQNPFRQVFWENSSYELWNHKSWNDLTFLYIFNINILRYQRTFQASNVWLKSCHDDTQDSRNKKNRRTTVFWKIIL